MPTYIPLSLGYSTSLALIDRAVSEEKMFDDDGRQSMIILYISSLITFGSGLLTKLTQQIMGHEIKSKSTCIRSQFKHQRTQHCLNLFIFSPYNTRIFGTFNIRSQVHSE